MTSLLPRDERKNPIPALRYRAGLAHEVSGSAGDVQLIALDAHTQLVSLKTQGKIKVEFGQSNVVASANSHGFLAGECEVIPTHVESQNQSPCTHISIYFVEDGTVYLSERE